MYTVPFGNLDMQRHASCLHPTCCEGVPNRGQNVQGNISMNQEVVLASITLENMPVMKTRKPIHIQSTTLK